MFKKKDKKTTMTPPWYKFYGDVPEHIDYPDISMYTTLFETSRKYPDNTALNYFNKKITYKELIKEINKCARSFKKLGIKEKDVVTICMPNTPEAVICIYALNEIGAIANMTHPLSGEEELKYYLNISNSKMLVIIDISFDKVKKILDNTGVEKTVIISVNDSMPLLLSMGYYLTRGRKVKKPKKNDTTFYWADFMKLGSTDNSDVNVHGKSSDVAAIIYSGGTTGEPKGVVLSNLSFNAGARQNILMCGGLSPDDKMLSILPIFHGFGLGVCVHTILTLGASSVLLPIFSFKTFHKLLTKYKPNYLVGVPTLFESLLKNKNMDNVDLSFVKLVISGGDSLSSGLKRKIDNFLHEHNSNTEVREGYGLAECLASSCLSPKGYYRENSIGIPFPDVYYKIVKTDTYTTASSMEDGEICLRGPNVMLGYLNNEIETNRALQKHDDGYTWLHTGDIGCMDSDGFVYFKYRLKRMIVSSGYNIYPNYVENVIDSHPSVLMSTVIGIDHPYKKQVAKAFIVLKSDVNLTSELKEEIKEHCKKNLAEYSIPYEFEYRDSLPKTLIGKVAYTKLIEEEKKKG